MLITVTPPPSNRVPPAAGGGSPTGNWAARAAAASMRALAFNVEADRGPFDTLNGSVYSHAYYSTGTIGTPTGNAPQLDTSVTCEGNGALRFDIPGANAGSYQFYNPTATTHAAIGGTFYANFNAAMDRAGYCDENINNVVYIQWRQKFNSAAIDVVLEPNGTVAIKHVGLVPGDIAIPSVQANPLTSGTMKLIMQRLGNWPFPILYRYSPVNGTTSNLVDNTGGQIIYQNGMPSPFCRYPAFTNCFENVADEWITFQLMFDTGGVFSAPHTWPNASVKMWAAYEGQAQTLIHHYYPAMPGYIGFFGRGDGCNQMGKINFFPYITSKDQTQEHDLIQIWYANLLIGSSFHADPA